MQYIEFAGRLPLGGTLDFCTVVWGAMEPVGEELSRDQIQPSSAMQPLSVAAVVFDPRHATLEKLGQAVAQCSRKGSTARHF